MTDSFHHSIKPGVEIVRTRSYIVLSRRRATTLFSQVIAVRELRARVARQDHLLVLALHELAVMKGVEPQSFIRTWPRNQPQQQGGEAQSDGS